MARLFAAAVLCAVALVALLPDAGHAWGDSGHKIVAQLADNMLTDVARPQVYALMEPGQTLPDIAGWPDDYDHTADGQWSSCLHYVNIPQGVKHYNGSYCPPVNGVKDCCVVRAINNYTAQVAANASVTPAGFGLTGEPTPLSFLVHFAGDVHQPLHAGFECDEGGTYVHVNLMGYYQTLHSAWDSGLIDNYNKNWESFAQELQDTIDSDPTIVKEYTFYMNPAYWASESYNNYVLHVVYDFSDTDKNQHTGDAPVYPSNLGCPIENTINLPNSYQTRNIEAVKQRLMAGGIRLATILNNIFDPKH